MLKRNKIKSFLLFIFSFLSILSFATQVFVLKIENYEINPIIKDFIVENLQKAQKENYDIFIIQLDTPGGLLESTHEIVKAILNAKIPVIVYVAPEGARAASAGAFITLSAHIAAMAPSTHIGAAHPITIFGNDNWPIKEKKNKEKSLSNNEILSQKIMNDTLAWIKSIAKNRNRNVKWYEEAVKKSISITANDAVKEKVVDLIANNIDDLLKKINGKEINVQGKKEKIKITKSYIHFESLHGRDKILYLLSNSQIAYIFLMIGFYGLLFEFTHPGFGFPGIAGTIALILALISFQALPISYAGMALILLGLVLLIMEFYTNSFGLLTLGSIISFILGSMMLIKSPMLTIPLKLIFSFAIVNFFIGIFLIYLSYKAIKSKEKVGAKGLVGEIGEALEDIKPNEKGQIFVHGEYWTAINLDKEVIKKGESIKVIDNAKNRLLLKIKKTKE